MLKVAAGIKVSTSVGPGPESRRRPEAPEIVRRPVPNKKKSPSGAASGTTYTVPAAG